MHVDLCREGGNRFPCSNVRPNCISQELFKERKKPGETEEGEVGWNHKQRTVASATVWSSIVRGLNRYCGSDIYGRGNGLWHELWICKG